MSAVAATTGDSVARTLVCLLGSFRLVRDGRPLNRLISGKTLTLLSMLAVRRDGGVPREVLLETLWPEQDAAQASVSLHNLVYGLGRRLRDNREAPAPIVYANGCYGINAASGIATDIARFDYCPFRRSDRSWLRCCQIRAQRRSPSPVHASRRAVPGRPHWCDGPHGHHLT
jgi:two-component SAPR family response regulator